MTTIAPRRDVAAALKGRHALTFEDYSAEEIRYLIELAAELKAAKRSGRERKHLAGKEIALIFEQASTRTRCAFEDAAGEQGAHVTFIGPGGSHMGHLESVKDTARVLGRMYDAIEYRGSSEAIVQELARWAGVPVYNGLTDEWHPTRMLAGFLAMREHLGKAYEDITFCHLGDARSDLAGSYLVTGAMLGMDVRIAAPRSLWPSQALIDRAQERPGRVTITEDVANAARGCDVVVTEDGLESPTSIVIDEAENRMHTIKAVMVATLMQ